MLDPIEELRVQRKLIQKHLDWLDAQIDQAESPNQTHDSTANEESLKNAQIQGCEEGELLKRRTETSNHSTLNGKVVSSKNNGAILDSEALDAKQVRFGCIAFFVIITLLFLFFLFGLPYLII